MPSSSGYRSHAVSHRKTRCIFFKPWGSKNPVFQDTVQRSEAGIVSSHLEELSTLKVRKDGGEEITLVQGKEQWLHFAGAAVKRYPMPKV